MTRLRYLPAARRDLIEIHRHIAPGLRGLSVGAYTVYHQVEADHVTVVRVLHAARDAARAGLA